MARSKKTTNVEISNNEVVTNMVAASKGEVIEKRTEVKLKYELLQRGTHTVYLNGGKYVTFRDGVARVALSTVPILKEMGVI